MRASTSCCRRCSSPPLLAEAAPGPAAPPIARANGMPSSAEWLCCETLAGCTPNPFLHLFVCLSVGCSSEAIARAISAMDSLALDTWIQRHRHDESLISHASSLTRTLAFSWLLFLLAFCQCKDQILCCQANHQAKPTLPLTNPLATTIRHEDSRSRTPPSCPLPT